MELMTKTISYLSIVIFAATHLFAYKLKFLGGIPRSIWLSAAGGITVAHVFLQLYPEVAKGAEKIHGHWLLVLKHPAWFFLMLGLVLYYGIERHVMQEKKQSEEVSLKIFWTHITFFCFYNFILAYVLTSHHGKMDLKTELSYTFAYTLHFLVNDFGFQQKHPEKYVRKGRWYVAMSILAGAIVSSVSTISETWITIVTAFLAGAITLNMIKEELPVAHESKFLPFLLGAIGFSLLVLLI